MLALRVDNSFHMFAGHQAGPLNPAIGGPRLGHHGIVSSQALCEVQRAVHFTLQLTNVTFGAGVLDSFLDDPGKFDAQEPFQNTLAVISAEPMAKTMVSHDAVVSEMRMKQEARLAPAVVYVYCSSTRAVEHVFAAFKLCSLLSYVRIKRKSWCYCD